MCRWMESHFHDWIDCNAVTFLVVTRMGSHIFGISGMRKFQQNICATVFIFRLFCVVIVHRS